jgi:tyrosinase
MRRAVGDDFRLPYWDWTADAGDPELSAVWDPEVVGGDGDPVSSGPFQVGAITGRRWEVRLEADPLDGSLKRTGRGLRRSFGAVHLSIPSAEMVREAVSTLETYDTFPWDQRSTASFRQTLEGAINDSVHVWIGRDMELSTAPNDPVFFLHHANIDRIWRAWQECHTPSSYAPNDSELVYLGFHRLNDRLHSFFERPVTPNMLLDPDSHYRYDTLDL